MAGSYDGSINISTKLDSGGFKSGMDGVLAAAKAGATEVAKQFEGSFPGDTLGASFNKFIAEYVVPVKGKIAPITKNIKEIAPAIDKVTSGTGRWGTAIGGVNRILSAMIPGFYRINRAVGGIDDISKALSGAGDAATAAGVAGAAAGGTISKTFTAALSTIGIAMAAVAAAIALLVVIIAAALVATGKAVFDWAQKTVETLYSSLSATSGYRDRVVQLKTAFDSLKGSVTSLGTTLLTAIAPALMTIISWLTQATNWASMFVAALSGQKTVMQYVSGAIGDAADNAGQLAKNTKKAGEAAKGALANFDMLNVLQMAETDKPGGGGGGIVLTEVSIIPKVAKAAEQVMSTWEAFWKDPFGSLLKGWGWVLTALFEAWKEGWSIAWGWIKQAASDAWEWIKTKWGEAGPWFSQAWADIKGFFSSAWDAIKSVWNVVSAWFNNNVIIPIKNWFDQAGQNISGFFTKAWGDIQAVWSGAAAWFDTTIWTPIKDKAAEIWEGIKSGAVNIGIDIANGVVSAVNGVIGFINSMINGLEDAINGLINLVNRLPLINIPNISLPNIGTLAPVRNPSIPYLATGAIIPPNAPFAAMLGDHKSQNEILAPEDMIRRIVREEAGRSNNSSDGLIHNVINLDGQVLYDALKKVEKRVGSSMARSTSAA